jgi:hypothetical protein
VQWRVKIFFEFHAMSQMTHRIAEFVVVAQKEDAHANRLVRNASGLHRAFVVTVRSLSAAAPMANIFAGNRLQQRSRQRMRPMTTARFAPAKTLSAPERSEELRCFNRMVRDFFEAVTACASAPGVKLRRTQC